MSDFKCPECGHEGSLDWRIDHAAGERVTMTIRPHDNSILNARVMAAQIKSFARLMEACAEASGHQTEALIHSMSTDEKGAVSVTLSVMPVKLAGDA
jgi:hypothetical protein